MRRTLVALSVIGAMLVPACAQPPNRGEVLVFAKAKDAVKLDPADVTDGESSTVTVNIFDTLVEFEDETTNIQPALATSWTISPDGRTYTFQLRPGVTFHDGTPCDADAIVFNYDRQRDPESPWRFGAHFEYWNLFFSVVDDVRAQGTDQIVFTLRAPDATFLTNLALFNMGIVSPTAIKTHKEDIGRHPVGTGPFQLATWIRGEKIVLTAFADHWGGKPAYDKLIFKPVPDNAARLLELENGDVQGMDGINPDDVARIEKNPDLQLLAQPGMNVGYLSLNNDKKPFDNPKVRRAISHALNKEALVKAFFAGGKLGTVAANPMPPSIWGHHDGLKPLAYDPAKAKQLLAEAGLPQGFEMTLWAMPVARPYMPQPQRIAEAIQADLRAVGIRAKIQTYEWGIYLEKLGKGDHEAALMGWIGDNGDPDNFLYTLLDLDNTRTPAANNYSFYRNQFVHERFLQARKITDQAQRARLYQEAQAQIHHDVPLIPLFHSTQMAAFRKHVDGYKLNPTGMKRFRDCRLLKPVDLASSDQQAAPSN